MGQHGANLGPTWGLLGAYLGPTWANLGQLGPTWGQLKPTWANMSQRRPTWYQLESNINLNFIEKPWFFLGFFDIWKKRRRLKIRSVSAGKIAPGSVRATQNRARSTQFERRSALEVPPGLPKILSQRERGHFERARASASGQDAPKPETAE